MKNNLAIVIILSAAIIGGAYIYVQGQKSASIERQQQVKINTQQQDETERLKNLDNCLLVARIGGVDFWNRECKALGRGEDCLLPTWNAERVDEAIEKKKEQCLSKYK